MGSCLNRVDVCASSSQLQVLCTRTRVTLDTSAQGSFIPHSRNAQTRTPPHAPSRVRLCLAGRLFAICTMVVVSSPLPIIVLQCVRLTTRLCFFLSPVSKASVLHARQRGFDLARLPTQLRLCGLIPLVSHCVTSRHGFVHASACISGLFIVHPRVHTCV